MTTTMTRQQLITELFEDLPELNKALKDQFGEGLSMDEIGQAEDLQYEKRREAELAQVSHIRKKAGPNLGNQWYSHAHRVQFIEGYVDPMSQTLCGAPATTIDQSWAETRFAKGREWVKCQRCIELRLADPKARK